MKNEKKIEIDDLLKKIPNKYKLAIIAGQLARKEFLKGTDKSKIIDNVFVEIIEDDLKILD